GAGHGLPAAHAGGRGGGHQPVPDHHHHGADQRAAGRPQPDGGHRAGDLAADRRRGGRAGGRQGLLAFPRRGASRPPRPDRADRRPAHGPWPVRHARRAVRRRHRGAMMDLPPPVLTPPAPIVSAALTDTSVRVTSGFRGERIVLYGAVFDPQARPSDVVVIVRGPDQPIRIARKTRVAGLWINSRPVLFEGAPGFYMAASTRPLSEIADFGQLRRLGAGVDHLPINAPEEQRTETRYG